MKKYTHKQRRFLKFFIVSYYLVKSTQTALEVSCYLSKTSEKLGNSYLDVFGENSHQWRDLIETGDLGHVYLIKAGQTSDYKIGRTRRSLDGRLKMLQIGNPFVLELKRDTYTYFYKELEKVLHFILADSNIRSEWFELDYETFKALDDQLATMHTTYK